MIDPEELLGDASASQVVERKLAFLQIALAQFGNDADRLSASDRDAALIALSDRFQEALQRSHFDVKRILQSRQGTEPQPPLPTLEASNEFYSSAP